MKINEILNETPGITGSQPGAAGHFGASHFLSKSAQDFTRSDEYRQLQGMDPKFARRLSIAWEGDLEHAAKNGAAAGTVYLVPRLLSDASLSSLTTIDPAAIKATVQALMYKHGLAVKDAARSTGSGHGDVWSGVRVAREDAANFDQMLEQIRNELDSLDDQ